MREVYKNPMLYYVLIPVLVGLWPLLVWAKYLPEAEKARETEGAKCVEGQTRVIDILTIDPDRPIRVEKELVQAEFTYGTAVERAANLCKIPAGNWTYSAGNFMTSSGKKRQDARVKLTNVNITQAASFLSKIQSRYPARLTCESLKLQKKKGMPDQWDIDFSFLYYY